MLDYTLTVFFKETLLPVETVRLPKATAVMAAITDLLGKHPGCECIKAHAGPTYLFTVECGGSSISE